MEIPSFTTFTEKDQLEQKKAKKLEEFHKLDDEDAKLREEMNKLSMAMKVLNQKKADIAASIRQAQAEIQKLEERERLEKQEEERLAKLRDEAKELEKYHTMLEELTQDFPAWGVARAYQKEDILLTLKAYLEEKSGMLLSHDMSLGKTFIATILLYVMKQLNPDLRILWLTKKSLTISTPIEIKRWWPEANLITSALAKNAESRARILDLLDYGADFLVANYEFIKVAKEIENYEFDILVVDEAHKLKGGANPSGPTDIWKATKKLRQRVKFTIFLTGTPMVNRPEEMWAYLNIFDEERFPTVRQFERSLNTYRSYMELQNQTEKASALLQGILRGQMIRRTAEEVGLQLPPITPETIMLEMTPKQREAYNQMRDYFYIWLDQQEDEALTSTSILAQLIRLRQINVWPNNIKFEIKDKEGFITDTRYLMIPESSKIDEAMDIIDNVGDQIVVFSTFNEPLFEIQNRVGKKDCEVLYGDNSWDVGRIEKQFQQGNTQVLCMNSAVGEGLNLQKDKSKWPGGARYGIMLDKWYSPARNDQCLKRIVRPGSNDRGTFYYLENTDSVDAWLNILNQEKQDSFDSITKNETLRPKNWKQYLKDKI